MRSIYQEIIVRLRSIIFRFHYNFHNVSYQEEIYFKKDKWHQHVHMHCMSWPKVTTVVVQALSCPRAHSHGCEDSGGWAQSTFRSLSLGAWSQTGAFSNSRKALYGLVAITSGLFEVSNCLSSNGTDAVSFNNALSEKRGAHSYRPWLAFPYLIWSHT